MNTITIFLLIAMSTGWYNQGNSTKLGTFLTLEDCQGTLEQVKSLDTKYGTLASNIKLACVKAEGFVLND